MDLQANISRSIIINPGSRRAIDTGLFLALPTELEAQIRPRSGLAAKNGITVLNAPGTIDSDYRGEIKVILINLSQEPFHIKDGDRVAQMVIAQVEKIKWKNNLKLSDTERGSGGFGSTGKN
jgi:dUTP pyrophosphatase